MNPDEIWKNFALGIELDNAGTFIYNGCKRLDEIQNFSYPSDVFEILYSLTVGLERLMKVAVILFEHSDDQDVEEFEKSLITHDVIGLANRISEIYDLKLNDNSKEFLSLLSKFYKSYRYGRFSIHTVPGIKPEHTAFISFLSKHLNIDMPEDEPLIPFQNTDQIRKFVGKLVMSIAKVLFNAITDRSLALNIYTDELRGDSKAIRVFYGDRLDFIDERIKKKELLIFLMNTQKAGDHIEFIRTIDALGFDPALAPCYVRAILNDSEVSMVGDEVDELYNQVEKTGHRIKLVELIDKENLTYE